MIEVEWQMEAAEAVKERRELPVGGSREGGQLNDPAGLPLELGLVMRPHDPI
mgnify:CR=1 FL=1|jgi:hypothetical protein